LLHVVACNPGFTTIRTRERGEYSHCGTFASAIWTEQTKDLTRAHGERNIGQRLHTVPIGFGQVGNLDCITWGGTVTHDTILRKGALEGTAAGNYLTRDISYEVRGLDSK
jgi:hypothetical protein